LDICRSLVSNYPSFLCPYFHPQLHSPPLILSLFLLLLSFSSLLQVPRGMYCDSTMPPCHGPSIEVPPLGVEPSQPHLMTFSAQRYEPQVRPPPPVRINSYHEDKQGDIYFDAGSILSLPPGPHSLVSVFRASFPAPYN
jgi:hypothetical protein